MLTQSRLKELLHYDHESGVFTRLQSKMTKLIGSHPGTIHKSTGYIYISLEGINHLAHQLAFLYMTGSIPEEIDLINGIRTDVKWKNLRPSTRKQNCLNQKMKSTNTSGFKGVHFVTEKKKWKATLANPIHGLQKIHVGFFDTPEKADAALRAKREELHGAFANHG